MNWLFRELLANLWSQVQWWHIAAAVAGVAVVVIFVAMVMMALRKYTPHLMIVCTLLILTAWWAWPRTLEVPKVVYKEPPAPFRLPPIILPKIPPITIKWPDFSKDDSEARERAAREKEEREKARREAERRAELERIRKRKEAEAVRKRWIAAQRKMKNAAAWAEMDWWFAREMNGVMAEYNRERQWQQEQFNAAMQPPPIHVHPPVINRR